MKILCVGRNYAEHAHELNNPIPDQPLIFLKPDTAQLLDEQPLFYPSFTKDLHFEAELLIKICKNGKHIKKEFASTYYNEISVGIDFTARDIQKRCKEKGHPWEIAKSWNHSAAIGRFISLKKDMDINDINFSLKKNNELVQSVSTSEMLNKVDDLICYLSKYFMLLRGDLIFTGTPKGVGPVEIGDTLEGFIEDEKLLHCEIK